MSMYMRQKAYNEWSSFTPPMNYARYMFNREASNRSGAWSIYAGI